MALHKFHSYPSSYLALVTWGATAFMAQPTVSSLVVHFIIVPLALATTLWLAHWEGRSSAA